MGLQTREPGFVDMTRYSFWFLDPDFVPRYVTRNEMAQMLGRSSQIVDNLVHVRGFPARKNDNRVEIPLQPFLTAYFAHVSGLSVEEYKAQLIEEARRGRYLRGDPGYREQQPAADNDRVKTLEDENRRLRARLAHLEQAIA